MVIGPYQVIGQVASTRAHTIWKAHDPALDRFVALKQLTEGADPAALQNEAQILARLDHPNIVRVIEVLSEDDRQYLVQEWLEGASLAAVRDHAGRLSPPQAVGVVRGGLQGLAYAHGRQVVHGDVSPGNILIDLDGVSKLIDFGSAVFDGDPAGGGRTSQGTAGYQAPEVEAGGPITYRSDVYSAAAILVDLLSKAGLSRGDDLRLDGIAAPLAAVLRTALDPEPAVRQADAGILLAQLEEAAERSLGTGWLGLAGVGGLVSATLGAGGVALIASETTAGTAVAAAAATPLLAATATKQAPKKWVYAGAGAAAVVAIVVIIALLTSSHRSNQTAAATTTSPATGKTAATASTSVPPTTQTSIPNEAPSTSSAISTPPSATSRVSTSKAPPSIKKPVAPKPIGFNGTYRMTFTTTKSNTSGEPVGTKTVRIWKVKSACSDLSCPASVKSSSGSSFTYRPGSGSFRSISSTMSQCVVDKTNTPFGPAIAIDFSVTLNATSKSGVMVSLKGTEHEVQRTPCPTGTFGGVTVDHADPKIVVDESVVGSRTGP